MTLGHTHPQRSPEEHWLPRAEHVWVDGTPGLLCAWRRHPKRGWQAWVICAELDDLGEPVVRQAWVGAGDVRPVD